MSQLFDREIMNDLFWLQYDWNGYFDLERVRHIARRASDEIHYQRKVVAEHEERGRCERLLPAYHYV